MVIKIEIAFNSYYCIAVFNKYILISNVLGAESIGGIFNTLIQIEDHGNRVLVEQSAHEMKKGSFDIALRYLDKALSVSTRVFAICLVIHDDFQSI